MDELNKAVALAVEALEREEGITKLEPGDGYVFQLNNCVLLMAMDENRKISSKFIVGLPIKVDYALTFFEELEDEEELEVKND